MSEGRRSIVTRMTGSNLRVHNSGFVFASAASGGDPLALSGTYTPLGIVIKNAASAGLGVSGILHVGSSGNPPNISGGFILQPGDREVFNVDRPDYIRVFSRVSGIGVNWYGIDF